MKYGNSFIKNDIIYMNLLFTYKYPIILRLLKIVTFKFTTYILTILTYSLKLCDVEKKIFFATQTFLNPLSMNIAFAIKDYSSP